MDRKAFYDTLRPKLGSFTEANVLGFERFMDEALRRKMPLHEFAYVLATVWWETGKTMASVKEGYYLGSKAEAFRRRLRYYPYYGRSYPQFTWERNYRKASARWNAVYAQSRWDQVDFVKNPDLILDPKYGVPLTFDGMELGWFTGKGLSDYIDDVDESDEEDFREFRNARRVVNGTDRDDEIARLALGFEKALKAARYGETSVDAPSAGHGVPLLLRIWQFFARLFFKGD